ncbi:MAG: hypothetical protein EON60_03890 [Alphaproteobacteria bacterium]|nr:MAG: hypothetical protein EON60_03890 [Alphaproteobacteria bacterium]
MKIITLLVLTMLPLTSMAQERASGGTVERQMTWSSLRTLVDAANAKSDDVNARVNKIVACNKKQMIFVDTASGDGCVPNTDIANLVTCGDSGQIYDKSKKACIDPSTAVTPKLLWLPNDVSVAGKSKDYADCPRMFSNCTTANQRCKIGYTGGQCISWRTTSPNSPGNDVCQDVAPFKTELATCMRTN